MKKGCLLFDLIALVSFVSQRMVVEAMAATTRQSTTIQVCVGADCRVDGASDCLRMLQQQQRAAAAILHKGNKNINVKAVPCLGPCGDGPNVIVLNDDVDGKRLGVSACRSAEREPGSLVPADLFGANVKGVFQVRTAGQADTVMRVATGSDATALLGGPEDEGDSANPQRVRSTRVWYDRPRNERIMLQRAMHASILWGLLDRNTTFGSIDTASWAVAGLFWILSNFVMKGSLLETFLVEQKIWKKRKG